MQNSLWKLTALAGVVGIGFLAVLQAQKGLNKPLDGDRAAVVADENPDDRKGDARGRVDGLGDFEPTSTRARSTMTSVPRSARSASSDEGLARNEPGSGSGSDPFGENDTTDETAKPRATRPRGLDFREQSVPVARRAVSRSNASDDVPFGDEPESRGVTRAGGTTSREPAQLDVEPGARRVVPAGNSEPGDEFDPFEEQADSKKPIREPRSLDPQPLEPKPLEPSADSELRAPSGSGPQLLGPGSGDPKGSFEGDDLPSQPKRRAVNPAPEPASRDFDDRDSRTADAKPLDTDPVVGDFPKTVNPAAESDPFGDRDSDPGYRRTRDPKPRATTDPSVDPRPEPASPRPETNSPRPEPEPEPNRPSTAADTANPFGDIPLDGSFGDSPQARPSTKPERDPLDPIPTRDPLPRRNDPAPSRDNDRFDPVPRAPRESNRDLPERDPPPRRETTPRSTLPNDPLPRRDDVRRDDPPRDDRRDDRLDPLPRSNRDDRDRNEPDRRDLVGDGVVAPNTPKGPQRPQLKIEKLAPQNAVIGQPLVYNIVIRNLGEIAAHDVVVEDRIPKGTELSGTIPRAELVDKTLVWKLGTMQPNEEKKIAVRVTPVSEGQIGSIATVNFVAEVGAKTLITAPKLQLDVSAPAQARTGEAIPFVFRLKNVGSADAKGVIIRDIVPEGLRHPDGNDLEYELGTLGAGQSREVRLTLTAVKAGPTSNRAVATADGNITEEKSARVDIVGPALSISRTGPKKTYLGRQATYATIVSNESDRTSDGATVVETVPAGFDYVDSTPAGNYSPQDRTLSWRLDRMRSGDKTELKVRFLAKSAGAKSMKVRVVEGGALSSEVLAETEVVGAANLESHVTTGGGPMGVGDKATFRIVVRNRGNDGAGNVRLKLTLPDEVEFVSSDHRNTVSADGREVTFPSIARLEASRESSLQVVLRAVKAGDGRLTLHTEADDMRPIAKEEQVVILAEEESSVLSTPRR